MYDVMRTDDERDKSWFLIAASFIPINITSILDKIS